MKLQAARLETFPTGMQDLLGLRETSRMDDRIIRIACELHVGRVPPHPVIDRIMHEQIRHQGASHRSLRRSFRSCCKAPVLSLNRRFHPSLPIQEYPRDLCRMPNCPHEQVMIESVKRAHMFIPLSITHIP